LHESDRRGGSFSGIYHTFKSIIMGRIASIQLCPGYRKPMNIVAKAEVVQHLGLKGDVHALPDSSRQILLIEKETLESLDLSPGEVKENITTEGIMLMGLKMNDRLRLGNEVLLEITRSCSPCSRMEDIRPGLLKSIAGKRGMLARVVRGGVVHVGDAIEHLARPQ
jgi:MOSC domain-containing protein YiiM